jgi:hypothetical protein
LPGRERARRVAGADQSRLTDRSSTVSVAQAARRRERAASRYQPKQVNLLLVAEAPPTDLDRYFYFENVRRADYLFHSVVPPLLGEEPSRDKARQLAALKDIGVFLIDLRSDPFDTRRDQELVPGLIERVRSIAPRRVTLIKVNVYDAACKLLRDHGLPVVDARLPFPSTGRQREFAKGFTRALLAAGSELSVSTDGAARQEFPVVPEQVEPPPAGCFVGVGFAFDADETTLLRRLLHACDGSHSCHCRQVGSNGQVWPIVS